MGPGPNAVAAGRSGRLDQRHRLLDSDFSAYRLPLEAAKEHHDDVLDIVLK